MAETKFAAKRRLQIDTATIKAGRGAHIKQTQGSKNASSSESPQYEADRHVDNLLEELSVLWEQRSTKSGTEFLSSPSYPKKGTSASAIHDAFRDNLPAMPAIDCTSSVDSDESREAPPVLSPWRRSPKPRGSPRSVLEFDSPHRPTLLRKTHDSLERTIEERDHRIEMLESAFSSDTTILRKMKDTIDGMADERNDLRASNSSLRVIVGELESTIGMQERQSDAIKEECGRMQGVIHGLEGIGFSQENMIEFMRAEAEELRAMLAHRDEAIAHLERSFKDNATNSKEMITALGARGSVLEGTIEELTVENARLRARSRVLEGEQRTLEEAVRTELELFHIEMAGYDML